MGRIRLLTDQVANQIAAGEVVERPASVIKELVENSLDAGAGRIAVEFRRAGSTSLQVEDDGVGMSREDALLSLERHATSKLGSLADLDTLGTLGFRGEALPSIASVSDFLLQTRTRDALAGTEILVRAGKIIHVKDCGMPPGTKITVSQLFRPVPARRKFLKSPATESAHIIQCVRLYAIAHYEVAFTLHEDGRRLLEAPACGDLGQRIPDILGKSMPPRLLPVQERQDAFGLGGLVGPPGCHRPTRHEMITFVNRRPVESRTIGYALLEAYQGFIPRGRYPVAFLFLDLPPALLDVNVHPAKREVRFREEGRVRAFVLQALQRVIQGQASPLPASGTMQRPPSPGGSTTSHSASAPGGTPIAAKQASSPAVSHLENPPLATPAAGESVFRVEPLPVERKVTPQSDFPGADPCRSETMPGADPATGVSRPMESDSTMTMDASLADWRFLGIHGNTYGVFSTPRGLVVMDAIAARKTIWSEKLEAAWQGSAMASQQLLIPISLEMDPIGAVILRDHLDFLARHGFEVSLFGKDFFRIEGVPPWLPAEEAESFLRDIAGAFREGSAIGKEEQHTRRELVRLALPRVVRGSLPSGAGEWKALAEALFRCRQPLFTPDGRNTCLVVPPAELEERLARKRPRAQADWL